MTLNQSNPQRGTGVRKQATGVRPAVPAAPAAAAPPAPAANRPTGARRPGAPAPGGAPRPALRSGGSAPQGSKGTKYLMLVIIFLLAAMVAYAFIPMGGKQSLAMRLGQKYGLVKKGTDKPAEETPAVGLDSKYQFALDVRKRAQAFIEDQQKFKDQPAALTEVEVHRVLGELEKFRDEVYLSVDDLGRIADANGKDTAIASATAREEQKKQKAFAMELGQTVMKWRGPKEQIFASASAPEFVANKFSAPDPAKKPEEKRDPNRLLTVVAPATPGDLPKPVEPPKEDPKPAEPKPNPRSPSLPNQNPSRKSRRKSPSLPSPSLQNPSRSPRSPRKNRSRPYPSPNLRSRSRLSRKRSRRSRRKSRSPPNRRPNPRRRSTSSLRMRTSWCRKARRSRRTCSERRKTSRPTPRSSRRWS